MTEREIERKRLVELLIKAHVTFGTCKIADDLLANGVFVPPCMVGDKVYRIWSCGKHGKSISELIITTISMIDNEGSWIIKTQSKSGRVYQFNLDDIGNKIYVIKEEAEKMLERKKKNE